MIDPVEQRRREKRWEEIIEMYDRVEDD